VTTIDGPLLVLSGAGSGKTTVIVNRIANLIKYGPFSETDFDLTENEVELLEWFAGGEIDELPPELFARLKKNAAPARSILAITFTNKAARELKERIAKKIGVAADDVLASTFHSMCVKFLRRDIDKIGFDKNFAIFDAADQLVVVKECINELSLEKAKSKPKTLLRAILKLKDELANDKAPREWNGIYFDVFNFDEVRATLELYSRKLENYGALDFDDILLKTVQLFDENPDVLQYYQNRFMYIMVDEYQDTNHVQYKLISHIARGHGNLCVVGDDDQSIYKFRGADIKNILNFEKEFSAKVIKL
jgi:DNA helicase-2/ATP-dependent DNA helicase PcrA